MNRGFYKVPLDRMIQPKMAFCSPWEKFHFIMLPFRLRNAAASYTNGVLTPFLGIFSTIFFYIDDVLVFSDSWS